MGEREGERLRGREAERERGGAGEREGGRKGVGGSRNNGRDIQIP